MADGRPYRPGGAGRLRIFVKLTPRASRNAVQGIEPDGEGGSRLKVMVTAVPEAGKANAAMVKLLAKVWKIPRSSLTIAAGETSRLKELDFKGEPQPIIRWFGTLDHHNTRNDTA